MFKQANYILMNKSVRLSLLLCLVSLLGVSSCGGSTSGGGGSEPEVCISPSFNLRLTNYGGTWRGIATSRDGNVGGIIILSLTQAADVAIERGSCTGVKIRGVVSFLPCVPVTPISGNAGANRFAIMTIGRNVSSLALEAISDFSGSDEIAPVGIEMTGL